MANGLFKSSAGAGALSSAQAQSSTEIKTASLFNSQQRQVEQNRKLIDEYYQEQNKPKDNGGFFGGIGYAFEKLGLGFLQSIEGIWDFTAGGLADLFGAHDWAEQQMANDWVNYGHADEWYNPSDGWRVVGDVAGGVGTSVPALASIAVGAAITYFSGGAASPIAVQLITGATAGLIAGLGAAGTATKEAYKETGQLTGKEWGYGALSGFTEGAMEGVTDAIGFGAGTIVKNFTASAAKEGAKQVGKQIAKSAARQTLGKAMIKGFIGEAFEEGVQELIDPVWKRLTYDPNAENATFQEVAYAALIGGLSGAIMSGADVSIRNTVNYFSGSKINSKGGAKGVIDLATTIAETEGVNQSGNAQVDFVVNTLSELQESLTKTNGEIKTAKQKMLVGVLSKANTAAPLSIVVNQNADAILADTATTVKRLNDIGYKTSKGEAVTVEMLTQGVTGERGTPAYRKSLSEAMRTNEALRDVAVMSAAGQLNMDAARFSQQTLRGEQLFNQADLNHFVETATEAQKRDVGERLGITDWATVTADELKSRIVEYSTNGGLDQYITERNEIKELSKLEISKKGLPKYVGSIKQDGAVRYKFGDASVAIVKKGDTYLVYDYARDIASKPLTKVEANRVIKEIYAAASATETGSDVQNLSQQQTQEIDTFARENVPDYKNLVGAQQQAVRQTLRQARAAGVSEADQILYASVAARSGVNIEFVSADDLRRGDKSADAGYSMSDEKILVNREIASNPKARTAAKILLHEFTHGIIGAKKIGNRTVIRNPKAFNKFFTVAVKGLSMEQQIDILTPYVDGRIVNGKSVTMQDFLNGKVDFTKNDYIELREELAAHFVERELGNSEALKRIISDKPSFKDKLLSFLKRSKTDYSSNEKLSRAANALLKKYQKFFNQYATQTRYSPTVTGDLSAYQKTKAAGTDTQTRLSIKKIDGRDVVVVDTDQHIFEGVTDPKELRRIARDYILQNFRNDVYRTTDGKGVIFNRKGAKKSTNTEHLSKIRISTELDNFIKIAEYVKTEPNVKNVNPEFSYFDYYRANFVLDGKTFSCLINVGVNTQTGVGVFYEITQIKEVPRNSFDGNNPVSPASNDTSTNIIPNNGENVNPDGKKSGKKRYALTVDGENITGEVEQTKNLVALHNLSETSLLKVLQLGGFPMPSIAITKVDMGHSEYGDITVVFGRDTIDPQRDRRNKIYSRDGWTPTAPKVEYKPNDRALSKIHKKYSELVSKVGYDATRVLYNYVNDIERQLELHGGEIGIISELYDNTELMNLFLVDTGGELIKPIYKTIRSELSAGEVTYRKRLIDALGKDFLAEFEKTSGNLNTRKDFVKQHKERIVNALATIMQGKESIEETRENISNNFSVFALGNTLNKATSYLNNGGISVSTEYDATATQEAIRKATSKREYVSWVDKLFGGIEEKTGIYNGRDPYTNSGNRRSFEALHYEYTLENMVEAMLDAPENGGSGWNGLTLGQLQAKLAKEFKSIDEIRLNADNLTVKDEAAHEEFSENTRKMLSEITALMVDESKYGSDSVAYWTALDSAEMVVGEIADNRLFTLEKIAAYMKREYSKSYRYNDSIGNKILGLFEYVRRENDTDYFEAKPRRAVALTEIKRVLLPETASEKLIKELTARNIPYQIYDSSENARTKAIRQMDGIRFALPETDSQGRTLTAAQRDYFKDSKVVDKDGKLLVVYHQTNSREFVNAETGQKWSELDWKEQAAWEEKSNAEWSRIWKKQDFYTFDNSRARRSIEMPAYFFSPVFDEYHEYGERTIEAYLLIKNPAYNPEIENRGRTDTAGEKAMQKLIEQGYDGFIRTDDDGNIYEYGVFESNQIKLVNNKKPTADSDIRYSKRSKPIDGQMDIFRDIIGAQENTQAEAWDSDYTKQATTNADNIIKKLQERGYEQISVAGTENDNGRGRSSTGNNGQRSRMLDFGAVRRLFEETGVKTEEESQLYSKIVRELNGYSFKRPFANTVWKFGVVGEDFYTYDMYRIADTNSKNGVGTVFYLDNEIYKNGRQQGYTAGLYFKGGSNVYVSAVLGKNAVQIPYELKAYTPYGSKPRYFFDYVGAFGENGKFVATRGSTNQSRTTTRHERLHLVYDAAMREKTSFSQETYNAVRELKQFVEQQFAGRADDIHRSIKDYYVKELGYGKVEQAIEEIACDLYAEDLVLKNSIEQAQIRKLIDKIDKTLTDVVGKDGVRYALNSDSNPDANPTESDNSGAIGGLSRGQRAKFVANNTKFKVYSKLDAASVIDSIIEERLNFEDGQLSGALSGKSRAEVIEKLFTKLNSTPEGYRIGVALNIADYIINNAVLTDMYDTFDDNSYAMSVLSIMRRYMHGVNLQGIQSEIQYKFDKKNSINLVWGAKTGGQSPDVIAQELQSYGIEIKAINEAEQFFEMLEIYEHAKEQVNKRAEKIMLTAYGSQTEIEQLRQQIARDVLMAYDEKGTPSKYAKLVEKYTKKIADLKKDLSTAYKRNTLTNRIIDGAAYLRDVATKRNYVGAEIFSAPELTQWLKQLSKIKYRSDLRKSGVRKILLDYGQFYNTNNALLYDENPELSYIDNNVIDALNFIRQNALSNKPLSMEELQAAEVIIASAKHLFNNYDQIIIEGKKAKISELATEGNEIIKKSKNRTNKTFFNKIYGVFNKIIEPRVVIKSLENFNPNGILTRAYNEVTRGETEAGLLYIELTNDIDTYIKKHKRFKNRLASEYITVKGAELTIGQAISLYELSKRPQAQEGLYESGFSYIDKKGSKQTVHISEADIAKMYDAFTDTDKGFVELVETFFNVLSKQVKTDADMQILGYTNASEDFYFPIKRDSGTIAKNITDARSIMADWANVYNFSFNKDVKTGAKNKLFVTDVYSIITRHAKQLSTYAKMTVPLKNFSQIYSKNIGDKTNVVSIRNTINESVWGGAEGYLSKLFADIQGRATSSSIIEKMRGAYAKYQLGANLKVIISQITSYPTAGIMLDSGVMAKGFVMKTNWAAMDKYCPYARVRNFERGIVRAEGVIDKIGKVGDVLTKPIQWTDRFTIGRLWNACQLQVQKDAGLKYGTVENMQKAGDMLEEVIRLTQPNYTNTERSELMRSDSDIVRSFTMFTSVPLKQLSRLVESFGEYNALRSLIKSGDSDPTLSKRYKLAKKKIRRTLASVTIANLMYVLVGQFFKFLYNNMAEDDEEGKVTAKSFFLDMLKDFGSTTIGMLPVVRDIYGYFVNGYEIESFTGDMLNSIISSAKSLFELATKAASGEEIKTQEYMSIFRNSLYSIGQVTGIPVRNINNTITGLVRRFSPSAAYAYTSLFYNPKYSSDIRAALKKGDYDLAETIMGMLLKDGRTGGLNEKATKKLIELYDAGYTVLPKSIGDTLTYNGEEIRLTAAQQSSFRKIYSQANAEIEAMVNSAEFASLPAEKQARAIKLLYDAYYSKAQASVLKLASDNKIIMLSSAIPPSALAPHLSAISAIEPDTDKKGNVISGSKKAKVIKYVLAQKLSTPQKLLLILSLGYTIKDGDIRGVTALKAKRVVARYITNLKLSREEKTALAEKCGLTVKNGRIYAK